MKTLSAANLTNPFLANVHTFMEIRKMPKYKCVGCGQIHDDNDYSEKDGDKLFTSDFDMGETKVLYKHRCCNDLNSFGKLEYLKMEDTCSCLNLLKDKFCRCTNKVECYFCYTIKTHCGEELLDYIKNKLEATSNTGRSSK